MGDGMLNINPQTVCFIIARAKDFQLDESQYIAEELPAQDSEWLEDAMAEHVGSTGYDEVKAVIDDLEPDQQIALIALMWVGRGDYDSDDWDDAYAEAANNWTSRTAGYLMATPLVADYLEEGLALLGYDCEE